LWKALATCSHTHQDPEREQEHATALRVLQATFDDYTAGR
jgi:hypothetical protein